MSQAMSKIALLLLKLKSHLVKFCVVLLHYYFVVVGRGVLQRQPHRRSGLANLPSVGDVP